MVHPPALDRLDFREALDQNFVRERGLLVEAKGAHQLAPAFRFASEPDWEPSEVPERATGVISAFIQE